jgi:CubicO group peptidase (beta-lactamase class C family)
VLVARHGRVVLRESFGMMDVKAGTPLAEDALFRIYSIDSDQ